MSGEECERKVGIGFGDETAYNVGEDNDGNGSAGECGKKGSAAGTVAGAVEVAVIVVVDGDEYGKAEDKQADYARDSRPSVRHLVMP